MKSATSRPAATSSPRPHSQPSCFIPAFAGVFLAVLQAACVATTARAGTTNLVWHWSNPLPFGNNITALAYNGTNTAYIAAGERGQLYTSTDLDTWIPQDTGTRRALRSAVYLGDKLVVTGEAGTVLTGTDPAALTRVDLGTSDWLEGVAASTDRFVAVGDNAAIYSSTNGLAWTRRTVNFADWLRGVTYGNGQFIAVGENGRIATSPDGITWTTRTSGTSANLNRIVWTGLAFVAAGDAGVVLYSSDGQKNWRVATSGVTGDLNAMAVDDLRAPAAAGVATVIVDASSGLGRLWKDEMNPNRVSPPPAGTYYSALWNGSQFVLGGRAGLLVTGRRAGFSYNWSAAPSPTRSWLWDIATVTSYGTNIAAALVNGSIALSTNRTTNTFYSAVGENAALLQSDNGIGWQTSLAPANAAGVVYLGVAALGQKLVAVGTGGAIAISPVDYQPLVTTNLFTNGATVLSVVLTNQVNTLGLAWASSTSKVTADLQGICITDSLYVASGANGTLLTSPDAITWTPRSSPRTTFLSSVESFPGGFVASGDLGTLLSSTDGSSWVNRSPNTTNWIYRARWRGNQLVAVGQNGVIYTSPNGNDWTLRSSGVTAWLNDVILIDGTYYAIGTQGTVLASADAIQWTPVDSITGKSLTGAASINGQLVVVGAEGVILRTQAAAYTSPVSFLNYPKSPDEHLFLFSGSPDQRFRLDFSTNTVDWINGPDLEITDSQGVLLLLDQGTNNAARQFFRTMPR